MANRNVDKGREAENAVAAVLREHGMAGAERRTKRGGTVALPCSCESLLGADCHDCDGTGTKLVPADAGDLTGIPGVVVQVKWSGYKPLVEDMRRTDEQRRVAGADIGLLVRKRRGYGCARAGEWDAYLPTYQAATLMLLAGGHVGPADPSLRVAGTWHTELRTVATLLAAAGYGTRQEVSA